MEIKSLFCEVISLTPEDVLGSLRYDYELRLDERCPLFVALGLSRANIEH